MENNMYLMEKIISNRKVRETCITRYTQENILLTEQIIAEFKLNRIKNKYITKTRQYSENSYSRLKIREEEITYLLCSWIYEPFVHFIEKQYLLATNIGYVDKYEDIEVDHDIYMQITLLASKKIFDTSLSAALFQRSEVYRFDLLNEILDAKEARSALIKALIPKQTSLTPLVIEKYNLKWINDKYIKAINSHDNSHYSRLKMKDEEIFFIKKSLLFIHWAESIDIIEERFQDVSRVYGFKLFDLEHIHKYRITLTKVYFSMFEEGTLPMNQIQESIIKTD